MGPNVDKSFLQDVVEGILDQHDVTQLVKTTANENWTEAGKNYSKRELDRSWDPAWCSFYSGFSKQSLGLC